MLAHPLLGLPAARVQWRQSPAAAQRKPWQLAAGQGAWAGAWAGALAVTALATATALTLTGPVRAQPQAQPPLALFTVVGDAIPAALTTTPGDASRGRALVATRQTGLCLLCHTGPFPEERFQGNLAPDLSGAGARWSVGQLRLRVVDARRLNPATIMPPYHRIDALVQVGTAWRGQPLLTAQQVEDVVAFLATLKE